MFAANGWKALALEVNAKCGTQRYLAFAESAGILDAEKIASRIVKSTSITVLEI